MTTQPRERIESIDLLRGLVMVIMALDHVRDFWSAAPFRPEDLTQTSTGLFFTRFVTHFCAPVFILLSGVSIWLTQQRMNSKAEVSGILVRRGLLLIVVQITFLSFSMQFAYNLVLLEVIWVIGCSMIIMAALIRLHVKTIAIIGVVMIVGHNLIPTFSPVTLQNFIFAILHNGPGVLIVPGLPAILVGYSIIPWVGVMAVGYCAGAYFQRPQQVQDQLWRRTGLVLIGFFILLRASNIYGDPVEWSAQERGGWFTFLSFINVSKYPPSLLYLSLTLGGALIILSFINRLSGPFRSVLLTFGRVPFFYYLIHMPLIVLGSFIWSYIEFGSFFSFAFQQPDQWPAGYAPSLFRTYLVWILYVVALYFPCRWYAAFKRRNTARWVMYV